MYNLDSSIFEAYDADSISTTPGPTMIAAAYMNNSRLGELIRERASEIHDDQPGYWRFEYSDNIVLVITDESHNRMRVLCPVIEADEVPESLWLEMMKANFDRALDARYCVNGGTLWSAFIHPLEELSSRQFIDALDQVVTLAFNYGTNFSSSNLVFGGDE